MDVPRVLSILLLLIFLCSTASALKNDRGVPSFGSGPNFSRRNRRIALNEYLVPPPPPRHNPVRSGRVANPQQTEAPGYFSKFMSWLNPFGYGASSPPPLKSPPYLEAPFPPTPQTHGLPFNVHPLGQPGPSLHPSLGPQPGLPLYPPLGPPPGQHSDILLSPLLPSHPIPPLNAPPVPSFPVYSPPPATVRDVKQFLPPAKNNRDAYPPSNKGKPCNPCNKVPWIPMQGGGVQSDIQYPLPPQLQNGYLPPSNQGNHDAQHAASHEIRIPDFSQVQAGQNGHQGLVSPLPDTILYPGPIPPLYKPGPFDRPPQSSHTDIAQHLEPPSLPVAPSIDQGHKNPQISDGQFNVRGNHDLSFSGTQINQGHASVAPQNHGVDINKGLTGHKESFGTSILDNQAPVSGPSLDQEYHDPSISTQEHGGGLNHPIQSNQNTVTSFGSSSIDNHGFTSQSADGYHEPFVSNSGNNGGVNYLPPDLNPSASFGVSAFNNQDVESLNYQYSEDLSPSSSVVKNSHATTQTPLVSDPSTKDDSIHFEESPLLDLTKKSESRTDAQWSPPTTTNFVDAGTAFDNTLKTTTNYNLQTDNKIFEDSSSFNRPTESYSSSNVQNNIFGSSTPSTVDFENNDNRYVETSTISVQYTNQQDVSYIPPSGQRGILWPSLLLNTPNSKNESSNSGTFLDPLARWNNSSKEIKNSDQQGSRDPMDAGNTIERQQNVKRNKQVQVIIPYTSEYTPIPFQQSYGDWSVRNNVERAQARKVPHLSNTNIDNYLQQESKNEIRLINQLQSQFNFNASKKLNGQSARPSLAATENDSRSTIKANNSIDVRRLQKNIDNWTIQEYSKPTTSSTIQPSSPHPYLLPSKKIPTEYLTTTEPVDHANESNDNIESVKTYSLAGFSFNEVEHEGSASNRIEETQAPIKVAQIESSKSISSALESTSIPATKEKSTWDGYSISISPVNKERVYVVTPQPIPAASPKIDFEKQKRENLQQSKESPAKDEQKGDGSLSEFEAIEKAYQVLPQAVNNLAVASTGKEDVPLWGIMEHEEFASLNLDETKDETSEDVVDGPVLYSGHSKVSRAKR